MEKDNHPDAKKYLECSECYLSLPESVRGTWNCGHMPPIKRVGPGFPMTWGEKTKICPGRLITLPEVIETARARTHWDKGCLKDRYECEDIKLNGRIFDYIEILSAAISEMEMAAMGEAK